MLKFKNILISLLLFLISFLLGIYFNKNITSNIIFSIGYGNLIDAPYQIALLICQTFILFGMFRYIFKVNTKIDLYFVSVAYLLILGMILFGRGHSPNHSIGLNPFAFLIDSLKNKTNLITSFLNFMILFPFSFILILLNKKITVKSQLIIGFILSFTIEFLQLIFSLGVFDLSDIVLYFSGFSAGVYVFNFYLKNHSLV